MSRVNPKNYVDFSNFFPPAKPLTSGPGNAKIHPYAGAVDFPDALHLRAVAAEEVFPPTVIANRCAHRCGNPFSKSRFTCFYKLWVKRNAPPRVPPRVKIRG